MRTGTATPTTCGMFDQWIGERPKEKALLDLSLSLCPSIKVSWGKGNDHVDKCAKAAKEGKTHRICGAVKVRFLSKTCRGPALRVKEFDLFNAELLILRGGWSLCRYLVVFGDLTTMMDLLWEPIFVKGRETQVFWFHLFYLKIPYNSLHILKFSRAMYLDKSTFRYF